MKRVKCSSCLVIVVLFECLIGRQVFAQWTRTRGPGGDRVDIVATDGSKVFAVSGVNVFVSTDDGISWMESDSGLIGSVSSFVFFGTRIYAGSDSGVFLSTDDGKSWRDVNSGIVNKDISSLAAAGTQLLAGVGNSNLIYCSSDSGKSWYFPRNSGLKGSAINALASKGEIVYAATRGGGLLRSANYGGDWVEADSGIQVLSGVDFLAGSGNSLYAGVTLAGLFRSTDDGAYWTEIASGLTDAGVRSLAVNGTGLFVGTDAGVYCSTDNGETWMKADSGLTASGSGVSVRSLCIAPDSGRNIVFAQTANGVFRSTNDGAWWSAVNSGLVNGQVGRLASGGGDLFAATNLGLFCSRDEGKSWNIIDSANCSSPRRYVSFVAANGSDIFETISLAGSFRSSDGGRLWTGFSPDPASSTSVTAMVFVGSNTFAGAGSIGVALSTDEGVTWTAADYGLASKSVKCLQTIGGTIYAGTSLGVFRSTDNGSNWTVMNSGLADYETTYLTVMNLAANDTNLFAGTGVGLFISSKNGASWAEAGGGIPKVAIHCMEESDGFVFAGTDLGIFVSGDNGKSWRAANTGIRPYSPVNSFCIDGSYLYAGIGNSGVWRRPLSELTSVSHARAAIPSRVILDQNYPNPFNPSTAIGYRLSEVSDVTLKVYDVLGREVATLVNGRESAGSHTVRFDARRLASGAYFYVIRTGGGTVAKRMIFLK